MAITKKAQPVQTEPDFDNIDQKIWAIRQQVTTIGKSGYNSFHKYEYVTLKDILDAVNPALEVLGLVITFTTDEYQVTSTDGTCKVTATLVDIDTGEFRASSAPGYAKDTKGDKAIYKALTGASKYALVQLFALTTDSIDEPEDDRHEKGTAKRTTKKKAGDDDDFDELDD